MEDRQCKICMQYKPLEEFNLSGVPGKRFFTCRDCEQLVAPVQPSEFVAKFSARPITMCCTTDCDEPAHDNYPKCYRHMLEQWAEVAANTLPNGRAKPKGERKTICAYEGCEELRYVAPSGPKHKYCSKHYNEYQREKRELRANKGKPPLTEAQRHAGFDRDEKQVRVKGDVRKVCYIDHATDVMVFGEFHITRVCKADELNMHPMAFQGVMETITAKGYKIVERGERPEGARHD